jgi:phosphomannomutase
MRVLTERLRNRKARPARRDQAFDRRGWAQVLPDPDEPVVHIYAEGKTEESSLELQAELQALVEEIMQGAQAETESGASR